MGTLGLTTRGFVEKDFGRVAEFLHRSVEIAKQIERTSAPKTFKEFKAVVKVNDEVKDLRKEVCTRIPFVYCYCESCTVISSLRMIVPT